MARHEIDEEAERRRTSETSGRDDASNTAENREPAERERGDDDGGGPWAKTSSGDADSVTDS
jgi:hypothetical protein